MIESINPSGLSRRLAEPDRPVLVDVRLEEDYALAHLPESKTNCVFEVAFLERMGDVAPDKETTVCVYGATADSWLDVDVAESRVEWVGRNLLNKHYGRIELKGGKLRFDRGDLVGGEFALNMHAITCQDLAGDPLHDVLIAHLMSHDFFDVELYPEARFVITATERVAGATPGLPQRARRPRRPPSPSTAHNGMCSTAPENISAISPGTSSTILSKFKSASSPSKLPVAPVSSLVAPLDG